MADYFARIKGHYPSGRGWGTGLHVRTTDTPAALLSIWIAAVTSWWTDGTHGLNTLYPAGTILDYVDVATLDGSMKTIARTAPTTLSLPGTSSDNGLPDKNSIAVALRSTSIGPGQIGHMKLPAPVEGIVANGEYQPTPMSRVGVASRALLSAVGADGSQVFFFNRQPTLHKPTPFTVSIAVTAQASSKVASETSRVKSLKATFS